jgi:hypothetical protein
MAEITRIVVDKNWMDALFIVAVPPDSAGNISPAIRRCQQAEKTCQDNEDLSTAGPLSRTL